MKKFSQFVLSLLALGTLSTFAHADVLPKVDYYSTADATKAIGAFYQVKKPQIVQVDEEDDTIVDYKVVQDIPEGKDRINQEIFHNGTFLRYFQINIDADTLKFTDMGAKVTKEDCASQSDKTRQFCYNRLIGKMFVDATDKKVLNPQNIAVSLYTLNKVKSANKDVVVFTDKEPDLGRNQESFRVELKTNTLEVQVKDKGKVILSENLDKYFDK